MEYLEGKGGWDYLTAKYALGANSQLRLWVASYKQFEDEGLMRVNATMEMQENSEVKM